MELERISLLHGESTSVQKVLRMECEMLTKKVRLLESQYSNLESVAARRKHDQDARSAETRARLDRYENLEREVDRVVSRGAGSTADGTGTNDLGDSVGDDVASALGALGSAAPASLRRRLSQSAALGERCDDLERRLKSAVAERDAKAREADDLEVRARRAESKANDANQPYNYLVERISATELENDACKAREKKAVEQLEQARVAARSAREEAEALRADLQRALDARGELATIKTMLQGSTRVGSGSRPGRKTIRA